jgi:hypothetical protein
MKKIIQSYERDCNSVIMLSFRLNKCLCLVYFYPIRIYIALRGIKTSPVSTGAVLIVLWLIHQFLWNVTTVISNLFHYGFMQPGVHFG